MKKWAFAIGTTSRVPGNPWAHYLILDIDHRDYFDLDKPARPYWHPCVFQRTRSGWHIYTNIQLEFPEMLRWALTYGADPAWVRIAKARGYAFLADKSPVKIPWPVERMIIGCP